MFAGCIAESTAIWISATIGHPTMIMKTIPGGDDFRTAPEAPVQSTPSSRLKIKQVNVPVASRKKFRVDRAESTQLSFHARSAAEIEVALN